VLNLTIGSYTYTVATPNTVYHPALSGGSVVIDGLAGTETVQFLPMDYAVTLAETGLPAGTSWSVTFNGAFQSSSSPSIEFENETNGSYHFQVEKSDGLVPSPAAGDIVVSGPPTGAVEVSFHLPATGAGGPTPSQNAELIGGLLAGIAAAAVVISWVVWRRLRKKPEEDWFKAP